MSKVIDIDSILNDYREKYKNTHSSIVKSLLNNGINYISTYVTNGTVLQNIYYLVLWSKDIDTTRRNIMDIKNKFYGCNISTKICHQSEIINICSRFANPSYNGNNNLDFGVSILEDY